MTRDPKFVYVDEKPLTALNTMETYNITLLPVVDRNTNAVI
jgi:CBS domain-containing protein